MLDASKFLGVTSAYISAVECGKRAIPAEWEGKIITHYHLGPTEQENLHSAIENSKSSVQINLTKSSEIRRAAALQFCRSFEEMDDEVAREIIKIMEENKKDGL